MTPAIRHQARRTMTIPSAFQPTAPGAEPCLHASAGTEARCPLTGSPDVRHLRTLRVRDIAALYRTLFGIDVGAEFGGVEEVAMYRSVPTDLIFFHPSVTGSGSFYEQLARIPWYYQKDKFEFRHAARWIGEADKVLEVGCGHGHFADALPSPHYTGLEFSPAAVAACRERGLTVLAESARDHAAAHPGGYDAVCSFQVMEHVADVAGFLSACVRLTKPGGLLILSVPSADSFNAHAVNPVLNMPPHHVTWWTHACLTGLPRLYPIELLDLHQQTLSDGGHRRWYLQNLILRALYKYLGHGDPGLVNLSPQMAALRPIAEQMSAVLELGFEDPVMEPPGDSVIVVYRRRP
ncbi:class I SAM-dependent methyltransferase [Azospirillum thermophilum]|nr:class I SAM-dependent methyltransferase [Azospirillum thermophilum]